jgi:ribose-phosphate pyrophosphokinase
MLIGFPDYREPAQRLASAAGIDYAEVEIHRFPDAESKLRLPAQLPERVVLCRTLDRPNTKLVELELAAATARELGASHLTLVAPYLCYMRQDTAFRPGEAVSQRIIGQWLARCFDTVITVDPHLHRVHKLQDAVPVKRAIALTATTPIAEFIRARYEKPMLLGPDQESEQWVSSIAGRYQWDYAVASKQRLGDQEIRITLPDSDYRGRELVLVDDVASTGCTLEQAARELATHRPASVSVMVTHGLFVDDALQRLRDAGVVHVYSTDSILHATNRINLDQLFAAALIRNTSHDQ